MDHSSRRWLETLSFELNADQVATLNKLMPSQKYRFCPFDFAMKNATRAKINERYNNIPSLGGKTSYGSKRPMESQREATNNEYSTPAVTSNAPSVVDQPVNSMQSSIDLLNKMKNIVANEFPQIKDQFDFEILERGINHGYYITIDEFKIACRQIIRAMASKYPECDFNYLMNFQESPKKQNTSQMVGQEEVKASQSQGMQPTPNQDTKRLEPCNDINQDVDEILKDDSPGNNNKMNEESKGIKKIDSAFESPSASSKSDGDEDFEPEETKQESKPLEPSRPHQYERDQSHFQAAPKVQNTSPYRREFAQEPETPQYRPTMNQSHPPSVNQNPVMPKLPSMPFQNQAPKEMELDWAKPDSLKMDAFPHQIQPQAQSQPKLQYQAQPQPQPKPQSEPSHHSQSSFQPRSLQQPPQSYPQSQVHPQSQPQPHPQSQPQPQPHHPTHQTPTSAPASAPESQPQPLPHASNPSNSNSNSQTQPTPHFAPKVTTIAPGPIEPLPSAAIKSSTPPIEEEKKEKNEDKKTINDSEAQSNNPFWLTKEGKKKLSSHMRKLPQKYLRGIVSILKKHMKLEARKQLKFDLNTLPDVAIYEIAEYMSKYDKEFNINEGINKPVQVSSSEKSKPEQTASLQKQKESTEEERQKKVLYGATQVPNVKATIQRKSSNEDSDSEPRSKIPEKRPRDSSPLYQTAPKTIGKSSPKLGYAKRTPLPHELKSREMRESSPKYVPGKQLSQKPEEIKKAVSDAPEVSHQKQVPEITQSKPKPIVETPKSPKMTSEPKEVPKVEEAKQETKPMNYSAMGDFAAFDLDKIDIPKKPRQESPKKVVNPSSSYKDTNKRLVGSNSYPDQARKKNRISDADMSPRPVSPYNIHKQSSMNAKYQRDDYRDHSYNRHDRYSPNNLRTTPKYRDDRRGDKRYDDKRHDEKRYDDKRYDDKRYDDKRYDDRNSKGSKQKRQVMEPFPSPSHSAISSNTVNNMIRKRERSISKDSVKSRGAHSNIGFDRERNKKSSSKFSKREADKYSDRKMKKRDKKRHSKSRSRRSRSSSKDKRAKRDKKSVSPIQSRPSEPKPVDQKAIEQKQAEDKLDYKAKQRQIWEQYQKNKEIGKSTKLSSNVNNDKLRDQEKRYRENLKNRESSYHTKRGSDEKKHISKGDRSMSKEGSVSPYEKRHGITPNKSPNSLKGSNFPSKSQEKDFENKRSPITSKSKFSPRQDFKAAQAEKQKKIEEQRKIEELRKADEQMRVQNEEAKSKKVIPPTSPIDLKIRKFSPLPQSPEAFPSIPKVSSAPDEGKMQKERFSTESKQKDSVEPSNTGYKPEQLMGSDQTFGKKDVTTHSKDVEMKDSAPSHDFIQEKRQPSPQKDVEMEPERPLPKEKEARLSTPEPMKPVEEEKKEVTPIKRTPNQMEKRVEETPPILEHLNSGGKVKQNQPIGIQESSNQLSKNSSPEKDSRVQEASPEGLKFLGDLDSDSAQSPAAEEQNDGFELKPFENDPFADDNLDDNDMQVDNDSKGDDFFSGSAKSEKEEAPKMSLLYMNYLNKQKQNDQSKEDSQENKRESFNTSFKPDVQDDPKSILSQGPVSNVDSSQKELSKPIGMSMVETERQDSQKVPQPEVRPTPPEVRPTQPLSELEKKVDQPQKEIYQPLTMPENEVPQLASEPSKEVAAPIQAQEAKAAKLPEIPESHHQIESEPRPVQAEEIVKPVSMEATRPESVPNQSVSKLHLGQEMPKQSVHQPQVTPQVTPQPQNNPAPRPLMDMSEVSKQSSQVQEGAKAAMSVIPQVSVVEQKRPTYEAIDVDMDSPHPGK